MSIDEAISSLIQHEGKADIIAGGTDLLGVLKERILPDYPVAVINIKTIPEMGYIPQELSQDYPDAKFGVKIKYSKIKSANNESSSTSTLVVSVQTKQSLSTLDRKIIGEKVCILLDEHDDNYTNVTVSQVNTKKFLFFFVNQSFTENKTCQEWTKDSLLEIPPSSLINF